MMNGYQCPNCKQWVYDNVHNCIGTIPYYGDTHNHGHRSYKCPCGGEFDYTSKKKMAIKGFNEEVEVCPFCGKRMKGK